MPLSSDTLALARLRELCTGVRKLISLVPTVLPIIGGPGVSPPLRDQERRVIVDKAMSDLNLRSGEWSELARAIPSLSSEITLLADTLKLLQRGFDYQDEQHQIELNALAQDAEDLRARGVENVRDRIPLRPERRIYPEEYECIKSYASLVAAAVDLKSFGQGNMDDEGADATPRPHGSQITIADSPSAEAFQSS